MGYGPLWPLVSPTTQRTGRATDTVRIAIRSSLVTSVRLLGQNPKDLMHLRMRPASCLQQDVQDRHDDQEPVDCDAVKLAHIRLTSFLVLAVSPAAAEHVEGGGSRTAQIAL